MEIEKTYILATTPARAWSMLLDPRLMAECVPGMQSVEVISPTEYTALIQVKIAFISARFTLRTRIVEQRVPHYLRTEGSGEDTAVASALKQTSELFLTDLGNGQTELRTRVVVDVTGRLGTFGLSVMKTKADRMWDQFCENLARRVAEGDVVPAASVPIADLPVSTATFAATHGSATAPAPAAPHADAVRSRPIEVAPNPPSPRWWTRLIGTTGGGGAPAVPSPLSAHHIRVEVRRGESVITVDWPLAGSTQCLAWLREVARV